jgi:hypothetical protein
MFKRLRDAYTNLIQSLEEANAKVRGYFGLDEAEQLPPTVEARALPDGRARHARRGE